MRKKVDVGKTWLDICNNCKKNSELFAGVFSASWKDTIKYIKQVENPADKFSLATLAKDKEAIQLLYDSISLNEYQKNMISKLLKRNNELLLTLNPYILDPKYEFLNPVIDELVIDVFIQDKLLSLNEYEISILKRIVEYAINYGVNPNNIISNIINSIGCSSIPGRNSEKWLNKIDSFFDMLQNYEKNNGKIDDKMISNIAVIIKSGIVFPTTVDEMINYNNEVKKLLKTEVDKEEIEIDELKELLVLILFSMKLSEANFFVKNFNIDGISEEYYTSPGVVELLALKHILEAEDIDKIKKVANEFINNPKYEINLFNNNLMEENLLILYAKEFNKCKPVFDDKNLIETKEGIKFYDSGEEFYAIVKTLGAFSDDGKETNNYYLEWNDQRYRCHVNAVSLIRNDNLAFAEQDEDIHVKLGFLNFGNKMLLGGGTSDINSTPDSRQMGVKIYSKMYFPEEFINQTREWHNELDYERKNNTDQSNEFKKNPDFIVLDQEVEDITLLHPEDQKRYEELLRSSLKAAKDFGNIPILVINREKIAKNEIKCIQLMLDSYITSHDISLLKKIIIRFCNNRNGCRGAQHKYIRENYFSNQYFQFLLNKINDNILIEQKSEFEAFVLTEYKKMLHCSYDDTTKDLPITSNSPGEKRGI